MKLLKRAGALVLALSLLATAPVFADTAESYTDNLNKYTEDVTMPWSGYANANYASDVFIQNSGNGGFIDADAGPDGTAALQMTQKTDGNNVNLKTRTVALASATEPAWLFTFDFKIIQNPANASKIIAIGGNSALGYPLFNITTEGDVWKFQDAQGVSTSYPYSLYRWYKAVITLTDTARSGALIDAETGEVVITSTRARAAADNGSFCAMTMGAYKGEDGVADNDTMIAVFDNAVLTAYDCAQNAPSVQRASVETGAADVPRNQALSLEFDQVVSGSPVLTKADGTPVSGVTVTQTTANQLTIGYTGLLEKNTSYRLSLSGVTNGSLGCNTADITFKTENLHLYEDVEILSTAAGASSKTQVTFTISDAYRYPIFSGAVLAAVYQDGKMTGLDLVTLTEEDCTGSVTKEFALGTVPAGARLQLMLLDTFGGPVPLASGMLTLAN